MIFIEMIEVESINCFALQVNALYYMALWLLVFYIHMLVGILTVTVTN